MAKKGKGKAKKSAEPPEPPSEFDNMPAEALEARIKEMTIDLNKLQIERNYMQLERDTISTFYDITRKEVKELDLEIMAKDREMESMEENHQVEIKVYIQKVKHLEYEHKTNSRKVKDDGRVAQLQESDDFRQRNVVLRKKKRALATRIREQDGVQAAEISEIRKRHQKNLEQLRLQFQENLKDLEVNYESKVKDLESALELQRGVEIHEMEERKNMHINDLIRNHKKAFGQIKRYYNVITMDNLQLIKALKKELEDLRKKAAKTEKMVADISQENKRLTDPLELALKDVEALKHALKDRAKDILLLKNAKARFVVLENKVKVMRAKERQLSLRYKELQQERDELYNNYEETVQRVQRSTELKNLLLEKNLGALEKTLQTKLGQFDVAVEAAQLDPGAVSMLAEQLNDVLDVRNQLVADLRYNILRVTKSHEDMMRTLEEKFDEFGVPFDPSVGRLPGHRPADAEEITTAPAGLVVTH